MNHQD
jgi:hypothetical protein